MMAYVLKAPTFSDYGFLKEVHHVTLKEHVAKIWGWDEAKQDAFFKEEFESGLIQIIQVAEEDVGYLLLHQNPDSLYVVQLLVLPKFQNRGIGTQILKGLIERARDTKLALKLGVFKVNTRARGLYSSLGFTTCGETETHFLMEY